MKLFPRQEKAVGIFLPESFIAWSQMQSVAILMSSLPIFSWDFQVWRRCFAVKVFIPFPRCQIVCDALQAVATAAFPCLVVALAVHTPIVRAHAFALPGALEVEAVV